MSFAANDQQRMMQDAVTRLLDDRAPFELRRQRLAGAAPDRMALWPDFAALGVLGALLPERIGGFGGTARDVAVVMEACGRALVVEPMLGSVMASRVLLAVAEAADGDAEVAGSMLTDFSAGARVAVLAHGEGFDPFAAPMARAVEQGGAWRLSGSKPAVRSAELAGAMIVSARCDGGDWVCLLVAAGAAGLAVEPHRRIDSAGGATLRFADVPARLLLRGGAAAAVLDALEWGVVAQAAEACGIMRVLNARSVAYLGTRTQFGVRIGTFQALQHRAADMHIAAEEAVTAVDAVLEGMDAAPSPARSARVSAVKLVVDRAARRVGHDAVQLHGGAGLSDELDVSHGMRRLAAIRSELGGEATHRDRFAVKQGQGLCPWTPLGTGVPRPLVVFE